MLLPLRGIVQRSCEGTPRLRLLPWRGNKRVDCVSNILACLGGYWRNWFISCLTQSTDLTQSCSSVGDTRGRKRFKKVWEVLEQPAGLMGGLLPHRASKQRLWEVVVFSNGGCFFPRGEEKLQGIQRSRETRPTQRNKIELQTPILKKCRSMNYLTKNLK